MMSVHVVSLGVDICRLVFILLINVMHISLENIRIVCCYRHNWINFLHNFFEALQELWIKYQKFVYDWTCPKFFLNEILILSQFENSFTAFMFRAFLGKKDELVIEITENISSYNMYLENFYEIQSYLWNQQTTWS